MIQRIARAPRHREGGFTLVELLVVIVILGILSAVVVFAVRGIGDKGRTEAMSSEERILRTAEEAHCAQKGTYASLQTLRDEGYLRSDPGYWDIEDPLHTDHGPCNDTEYHLVPKEVLPTTTTTPLARVGCSAEPELWPRGLLCPVPGGPGNVEPNSLGAVRPSLVQLDDGKVLTVTMGSDYALSTKLYDPVDGDLTDTAHTGTWAQEAPPVGAWYANHRVHITNADPEGVSTCDPNCNTVLLSTWDAEPAVGGGGEAFYLYDPRGAPKWRGIADTPYGFNEARMSQINGKRTECGDNCGKVLVATDSNPTNPYTVPGLRLFDPKTLSFEVVPPPLEYYEIGTLAALPGGKMLIVARDPLKAWVFDPKLLPADPGRVKPTGVPEPVQGKGWYHQSTTLVTSTHPANPGSEVLMLGAPGASQLYNVASGGWRTVANCDPDLICHILAKLGTGKVLATSYTGNATPNRSTGKLYLFDPPSAITGAGGKWSEITPVQDPATTLEEFTQMTKNSTHLGVVLQDPCGKLCGLVLIAGSQASMLYKP